ncbi:MAG: ABC transporter ATP-binding protein [Nitrospirota bacterium]
MKNMVIEVRGLSKSYDTFTAVDNISFEAYENEILGILGPNGAGKTTIIHMLLNIIIPTSGSIKMFGLELQKNREKILSSVNFSSSYVSMPYSLTVMENLKIFAMLYGMRSYKEKIEELLDIFEITDIKDRLTKTLSSGQLTRLFLAKALINDPRIVFLDEPTASLDPDIADKIRKFLKRLKKSTACTIVYTSHNMREIEEISDRIIFLNRGKIEVAGRPKEVVSFFNEKNLEDLFIRLARGNIER